MGLAQADRDGDRGEPEERQDRRPDAAGDADKPGRNAELQTRAVYGSVAGAASRQS